MRHWTRMVATLLVVLSLGLHWAVLQSIAWAGMLARFLQVDSPAVALSKTFDGKHPCALCKVVRQATRAGAKQSSPQLRPVKRKIEACWLGVPLLLYWPEDSFETAVDCLPCGRPRLEPPTPPPRRA